jgi:hypothetical protein
MYAQTHFPENPFSRIAKTVQFLGVIFSVVAPYAAVAEPPVAQDTTVPNRFAFTCDTYFVDKRATSVVVTVDFIPGNRSWSGAVNFYTTNGTATAGIDYQPTNGTLNFSGPGTPIPVITVPILKNDSRQTNVTVELYLTNSVADIPRPHATLIIVDTNQAPPLQISRPLQESVLLSWPALYPDFVLEKKVGYSSTNWIQAISEVDTNYGYCFVYEPLTEPPALYRLRKNTPP